MTNLTTNKIRLQTQWRVSWPLVILEGSLASSYTCGRYWSGVLGCFLHHHHSKWGTINAIIAMVFTLTNRDIERCLGTLKLFWWDMTDQCLLKWFMPGFFFSSFFQLFFPKMRAESTKTPKITSRDVTYIMIAFTLLFQSYSIPCFPDRCSCALR